MKKRKLKRDIDNAKFEINMLSRENDVLELKDYKLEKEIKKLKELNDSILSHLNLKVIEEDYVVTKGLKSPQKVIKTRYKLVKTKKTKKK